MYFSGTLYRIGHLTSCKQAQQFPFPLAMANDGTTLF